MLVKNIKNYNIMKGKVDFNIKFIVGKFIALL